MTTIPQNYNDIENSPPYQEAQRIGARETRRTSPLEYWHNFDEQQLRLLQTATPPNMRFFLDPSFAGNRVHVGLEGYVRGQESFTGKIRQELLTMLCLQRPLPGKHLEGKPDARKVELHLPPDRQLKILQLLTPAALIAVTQAAYSRQCSTLMHLHEKNEGLRIQVIEELQMQYEKAISQIVF